MRHAFTLIELVVTLVIVGIVAAIAVPRMASAQVSNRLDAVAARLDSEFVGAGELARARGESLTIQISASTDTLRVYKGAGASRSTLLKTVDFSAAPYQADITATNIADGSGYLTVDAFGIYEAGAKVVYNIGGVSRSITVTGPTKGTAVDTSGGGKALDVAAAAKAKS